MKGVLRIEPEFYPLLIAFLWSILTDVWRLSHWVVHGMAARAVPGELLLGEAVEFGCSYLSRALGEGWWELAGGMLGALLSRWTSGSFCGH